VNAEAKRNSLNRRKRTSSTSPDKARDTIVGQFVNILRRCGYSPADIVRAVGEACRLPPPGQPRHASVDALEFPEAPHVMTVWHTDPTYTDPRGRPAPLPLQGQAPSLESLVRRVNKKRPVQDMLEYLLRAGAVERVRKRYVARTRWVSLRGMEETSARVLRAVQGLLTNYEHNLLPREQVEGWFEYTAENSRFPRSKEGALADFYQRDCMASLRRVDAFMLRCEQERRPGEPTMQVGFGMYRYQDEDPAGGDPPSTHRTTRPRRSRRRAKPSGNRRLP
jgi:hypothetical protein